MSVRRRSCSVCNANPLVKPEEMSLNISSKSVNMQAPRRYVPARIPPRSFIFRGWKRPWASLQTANGNGIAAKAGFEIKSLRE